MRVKENEPLQQHQVRLFAGDFEKLAEYYPKIGATVALRHLLRKHLKQLDEAVAQRVSTSDLEIDDE